MKTFASWGIRARLLGALFVVAGTLGACNLIVDAGKYAVGDAPADGSTEDVATNPDSGHAGGMDSGPIEAGPVTCGHGIASGPGFDQLVEGCLLAISCSAQASYFFDDVNLNFCLTYDYLNSRQAYSCLASAHTCGDVFKCTHTRGATIADCPSSSAAASCNGSLAVNCSGTASGFVDDCSATGYGGTCQVVTSTLAFCSFGSCSTNGTSTCIGNASVTCTDGQNLGGQCGTGFVCANGAAGQGCYFDAPSCASPDSFQCRNAGELDYCSSSKQLFPSNCALSGSTCQLDDAGLGYCISPGCDLKQQQSDSDRTAAPTCKESCAADGKTLNTCIGGAPFQLDCTKYDTFSKCTQQVDTTVTPNETITFCE